MTDDAQQRDTFLALREIITEAIRRCEAAEGQLKALAGGGDDRVSLSCQEILAKEEQLIDSLRAFLHEAPKPLLDTRSQYIPEKKQPPLPKTPEDAAAQLATVNLHVTEILDDLTGKLSSPDQQEAVDALRKEVETLAQHVSMTSVTLHDN